MLYDQKLFWAFLLKNFLKVIFMTKTNMCKCIKDTSKANLYTQPPQKTKKFLMATTAVVSILVMSMKTFQNEIWIIYQSHYHPLIIQWLVQLCETKPDILQARFAWIKLSWCKVSLTETCFCSDQSQMALQWPGSVSVKHDFLSHRHTKSSCARVMRNE